MGTAADRASIVLASLGVVRQGRAHLHFAVNKGGSVDLDDFRFSAEMENGEVRSMTPRKLERHSPEQVRAVISLPDGIVRRIRVFLGAVSPDREVTYRPGYELSELLPDENGSMVSIFVKSSRIKDRDTFRFQAAQISRSSVHGFPVKVEVLKIISYAAMEELDEAAMTACLSNIDDFIGENYNKGHKGHSKLNPDHIAVSLKFIRANLCLMLRRYPDYRETIEDMRRYLPGVADAPIVAFNLSIAMLVNAWIFLRAGNGQGAAALANDVVESYRLASWNMPAKKPKGFSELVMSLNAAAYAIGLRNYAESDGAPSWSHTDSAIRLAERFSRLTTAPSISAIAERYEEAARAFNRDGAA